MSSIFTCGQINNVDCFWTVLDHAPWSCTVALFGITIVYYDVVFFWLSVFGLPMNYGLAVILNILSNPRHTNNIVNGVEGVLTLPSFPSQFVFYLTTCALIYYQFYRIHNPAWLLYSLIIMGGLILYADVYIRIDHYYALFYGAGVGIIFGIISMVLYVLVLDHLSYIVQKNRIGGLMGLRNWYNRRSYYTENPQNTILIKRMMEVGNFTELEPFLEFVNAYNAASDVHGDFPYYGIHPKYHNPHESVQGLSI